MKKLFILLFLSISFVGMQGREFVEIWFKNGEHFKQTAESAWTEFSRKHNYYCFLKIVTFAFGIIAV